MKKLILNDNIINYLEKGDGSPLIILNGSLQNINIWLSYEEQYNFDPFYSNFRVIYYDQRNQGDSSKNQNLNFDEHINDLLNLVTNLSINKCSLLGVSYGSDIAIKFALKYPHLVDKLILLGPSNYFTSFQSSLLLKILLNILEGKNDNSFKDFFLLSYIHMFGAKTINQQKNYYKIRQDFFIKNFKQEDIYNYTKCIYEFLNTLPKQNINLSEIKNKTLIMVGEEDYHLPLRYAKKIKKEIKNSEIITFKESGHFFLFDNFEKVIDKVVNFIKN